MLDKAVAASMHASYRRWRDDNGMNGDNGAAGEGGHASEVIVRYKI